MDELSPKEVQQLVAEIDFWHKAIRQTGAGWRVEALKVYRTLPLELYSAYYANGVMLVWYRNDEGRLRPAEALTYTAPDFTRKNAQKGGQDA